LHPIQNEELFLVSLFRLFFFLASSSFRTSRSAASLSDEFCLGRKIRIPAIPNTGRINDHLYRGAQPKSQGLAELQKLGITTVVDLRSEDPETIAWERKQAETLSMHFVNIPVSGWSSPNQ
jgi:hypothetical protein